jgi:hypothetical protein
LQVDALLAKYGGQKLLSMVRGRGCMYQQYRFKTRFQHKKFDRV